MCASGLKIRSTPHSNSDRSPERSPIVEPSPRLAAGSEAGRWSVVLVSHLESFDQALQIAPELGQLDTGGGDLCTGLC